MEGKTSTEGQRFEYQDLQEFLQNVAKRFCPECGNAIVRNQIGRPKDFCCDECRDSWWKVHRDPSRWKSSRMQICPVCKKNFLAIRSDHRKYCSRACANTGRTLRGNEG